VVAELRGPEINSATESVVVTRGTAPTLEGKIERYHRSMKNVVRLENHYSPGEFERALIRFVEYQRPILCGARDGG
jgi:hypothetical protein